MFVSFDSLPADARLWVYAVGRPLDAQEQASTEATLRAFCTQWEAHHEPLQTSFLLFEGQFIVLAVDEAFRQASGCSIDSSVKVLRQLADTLQSDLFQRQYVAYWEAGKLQVVSPTAFKQMNISSACEVFDQTVATVGEFRQRQRINIQETWLKRYISLTVA
jgi:hypothetical protein